MVRAGFSWMAAAWVGLWAACGLSCAQTISDEEAARFLIQASFGPNRASIADLQERGYVGWLQHQMALPYVSAGDRIDASRKVRERKQTDELIDLFWEEALYGEDQLRQRMRFALSQIVVASLDDTITRRAFPAYLDYVDVLGEEALGNYCTLIRRVSFQPTMAIYLTFYKNQKADEARGVVPDENYAREIMQLFTIGLEELEIDGTPTGVPTYDQDDVSELAAVFTGLALPGEDFGLSRRKARPFRGTLIGFPDYHEASEKRVLGAVIGPGSDPVASVNEALDHLLSHPNVAPFVVKQLIQRFVSSNPSPAYVERVARVFNEGQYTAEGGVTFGSGERCDLEATTAAILLDPEAREKPDRDEAARGKVREPIIRAIHIFRALSADHQVGERGVVPDLGELHRPNDAWARQVPFHSPTVFNFFRPSYVRPGSNAEVEGAVAPETQIMTATHFAAQTVWAGRCAVLMGCQTTELPPSDLGPYLSAAGRPGRLVDMIDLYLTAGTLPKATRNRIVNALWTIDQQPNNRQRHDPQSRRVALAFDMVTTSPEFMVQR
ncbi:MAG: DUF1800 family protein [Pseudomonadota bacterium]